MSEHKRFIVVFKDSATKEQVQKYADNLHTGGGKVTNMYPDVIMKGFAAHIPESHFQSLQGDDLISYIEPDGVATTQRS